MGVDTKAFVAVKKEAVIDLMPKLIKDLNEWQRGELKHYADSEGFDSITRFLFRNKEAGVNKDLKDFTNGVSIHTHDFGSFNISFTVYGETRSLFITHTCSCDYSDVYDGDKIIFSLGKWGMDEEIMKVVMKSIKEFGDVYYTPNDCSDDFTKMF